MINSMDKQDKGNKKTREHILQVACKVFAKRGFRNATIRDICQQAHVNIASVNYYFSSKEKLYEEACKDMFTLTAEDVDSRFKLEENRKPEEKLKSFVQALLLNVLGKEPSNWRHIIMSREMVEPTNVLNIVVKDMIKPRFKQLFEIVKTLLGRGVTDEVVRRCCLSITGQCLYYRFARPVILRLNPQQKFDKTGIEKLADHITRFSLNAIKQLALENEERK